MAAAHRGQTLPYKAQLLPDNFFNIFFFHNPLNYNIMQPKNNRPNTMTEFRPPMAQKKDPFSQGFRTENRTRNQLSCGRNKNEAKWPKASEVQAMVACEG